MPFQLIVDISIQKPSSINCFSCTLQALVGVTNRKCFCQRCVHISKSWTGKASSHYGSYAGSGSKVHRIKVDEQAGFILTSFRDGGLLVNDLVDDQVLWSLPKEGTNASGFPPTPSQSNTLPDQISASEESYQKHAATYSKGYFKPWAILKIPRLTSAFRFVYPTLLVGARDHSFLWDTPSYELVHTIPSIRAAENSSSAFVVVVANAPSLDAPALRFGPLGHLNYVDVDEKHIFICDLTALRVFSRATGECVLDVSSARREFGAALVNHFTHGKEFALSSSSFQPRIIEEFVAVHASSCGRHLVAMLDSARVVILENFQEGPFSYTIAW
ncbi:uncharacterized protein C8R40DRAFT_1074951 [Lentinula edodes]|uniref:uncharacterized protein n=1 Tax=Lentinula edodes TaxID=5353 RepID=UPI001E8E0055|nr:uncharacterized protein C8R40DRAFT_1074951 [Lentinula edodes]KAH7868255.1 hypothetical protein C8R40DRAFT_1074951 [Lentinula edodes]